MLTGVDTMFTSVDTCPLARELMLLPGMQPISIEHLHLIIGGAGQAPASTVAPQAPVAQPAPGLSDAELEERFLEKEQFTRWEKSHPFSALICQGDRSCMR